MTTAQLIRAIEQVETLLPTKETWTKGELIAKSKNNNITSPWFHDLNCVRCLYGAVLSASYQYNWPDLLLDEVNEKLNALVSSRFRNYIAFNDADDTKFEDVRALLRQAKEY